MQRKKNLIYGVGLNDADYDVDKRSASGRNRCKYFSRWFGMLTRCYNLNFHKSRSFYTGCSVSKEWLVFTNFKNWMINQQWAGNHLDKDLLVPGNKIYSPETCVFVTPQVNSFLVDRAADRGDHPIGVSYHKDTGKLQSRCSNPFTKKSDYLGVFDCEYLAHAAWKARKHELACQLADVQTDPRVAAALRLRYA